MIQKFDLEMFFFENVLIKIYLVQRFPIFLVFRLAEGIEEDCEKFFTFAVKLSIQASDHFEEQLSTSHHACFILFDNLKNGQKETVFVSKVSHQECKAFNSEVDDVIRLVLFTQKRNDVVNDD